MRCKKHYTDLSSSIGVCACCLRERLLSLIAAEEQANHNLDGKHRIPSSAASSRKSDHSVVAPAAVHHHHHAPRHRHTLSDQQFFTTTIPAKKKSFIRFFSFQNIFRSKKTQNSIDSVSDINNATSSSSSTSWFSTMIHGGRHRRKPIVCVDESDQSGVVRRQYCCDRGMSPVRNSDLGNGDEDELQNVINGTPRRTPLRRGGGGGHVRNLSFCLSPLVRASPNRQRNQPEIVLAGEIRGPVKPHLMNTKSFCANRSRKLADFGRTNPNR